MRSIESHHSVQMNAVKAGPIFLFTDHSGLASRRVRTCSTQNVGPNPGGTTHFLAGLARMASVPALASAAAAIGVALICAGLLAGLFATGVDGYQAYTTKDPELAWEKGTEDVSH